MSNENLAVEESSLTAVKAETEADTTTDPRKESSVSVVTSTVKEDSMDVDAANIRRSEVIEDGETDEDDAFERFLSDAKVKASVNVGAKKRSRPIFKIKLACNSDHCSDSSERDVSLDEVTPSKTTSSIDERFSSRATCSKELVSYGEEEDLIHFFRGVYEEEKESIKSTQTSEELNFAIDDSALFGKFVQSEQSKIEKYFAQKAEDLRKKLAHQINIIHQELIRERDFNLQQV